MLSTIGPPASISSKPYVIDNGKSHMSISWKKPHNIGAAPVIAYKVEQWLVLYYVVTYIIYVVFNIHRSLIILDNARLVGAEGGARWNELGITPINCFDVFNVRPGSKYHFRVTPRNRYGWGHSVQTTDTITASESSSLPQFTKILPGQCGAMVGKVYTFECMYTGIPKPCIRWFKDEIPIMDCDDERIQIKLIGSSTCHLVISDVRPSDFGRYTCEAANTQGRVSTFARLTTISDCRVIEADTASMRNIVDKTV